MLIYFSCHFLKIVKVVTFSGSESWEICKSIVPRKGSKRTRSRGIPNDGVAAQTAAHWPSHKPPGELTIQETEEEDDKGEPKQLARSWAVEPWARDEVNKQQARKCDDEQRHHARRRSERSRKDGSEWKRRWFPPVKERDGDRERERTRAQDWITWDSSVLTQWSAATAWSVSLRLCAAPHIPGRTYTKPTP